MFMLLFSTIFELVVVVGVCWLVYSIFLQDVISGWISSKKEKSIAKDSANKIAVVKLLSDSPQDIEQFVSANAKYLSDETVKKLAERIEIIKCDQIIYEDSLGKRISNTAAVAHLEDDDEFIAPVATKGRGRKR